MQYLDKRREPSEIPTPPPGFTNVVIKVYYNVSYDGLHSHPSGYRDGDELRCTCEVTMACAIKEIPYGLLDGLILALATDHGPLEFTWITEYLKYVPRRIGIGDVLQVGESAWWIKKHGEVVPITLTQEQVIPHTGELILDNLEEMNKN